MIHHSDRAANTAVLFTARCKQAAITPSTGSKGDCFDNAVSESFHASLRRSSSTHSWPTRAETRTAVFEYIEGWYNPRRRHSTLGYPHPQNTSTSTKTAIHTTSDTPPLSTPAIA